MIGVTHHGINDAVAARPFAAVGRDARVTVDGVEMDVKEWIGRPVRRLEGIGVMSTTFTLDLSYDHYFPRDILPTPTTPRLPRKRPLPGRRKARRMAARGY